ncbi:uncharacterized protein PADG_11576 [Paracoccidioides brasiliensis Pb18]|uniref:Uncharacterized protein n=1 Tax=Paracoccidioides brasiliensis (strain Pb18) TaxID=502780 RepID=A0A0A0HUU1_PARBD|nr:uncharacterized protein PADG_11576 [Paracoccidioides brasiliensis Pb18]KGM92377.1 hypothetical protein PADG_11576 [Paracoccidioides brasiliensis Pb18]
METLNNGFERGLPISTTLPAGAKIDLEIKGHCLAQFTADALVPDAVEGSKMYPGWIFIHKDLADRSCASKAPLPDTIILSQLANPQRKRRLGITLGVMISVLCCSRAMLNGCTNLSLDGVFKVGWMKYLEELVSVGSQCEGSEMTVARDKTNLYCQV